MRPIDSLKDAMQRRVVGEVLANRLVDAIELALDDAFFGLPACGEQHVAIARARLFSDRDTALDAIAKAAVQASRRGLNRLAVRSAAYEVKRGT